MIIIGEYVADDIRSNIIQDVVRIHGGKFTNGEVFTMMQQMHYYSSAGQQIYYIDSVSRNFSESILQVLSNCHLIRSLYKENKINLILTFLPFMRQDKFLQEGYFFSKNCQLIPELLKTAGVNKLITIDVHSIEAIKSCTNVFGTDFINLLPLGLFAQDIASMNIAEPIILGSTDGLDKQSDRAFLNIRRLQKMINCKEIFLMKKERTFRNIASSLVSGDPNGKVCIVLDDIINSGKSALNTALALKRAGAHKIFIYATHLIDSTAEDFKNLLAISDRMVVSNSISIKYNQLASDINIRLINLSNMLKELLVYGSKTIF